MIITLINIVFLSEIRYTVKTKDDSSKREDKEDYKPENLDRF